MINKRYFEPIKQVVDYVESKAEGKVLELGPSLRPFAKANYFCGHSEEEKNRLKNYSVCDFSSQVFPYKNKEFDFIYARHVVEDLYNPKHFLNECKRVAKAGYIENPSPLVENTKYIESDKSYFKGYHHHHSVVWSKGNDISILHKYPIIDCIQINIDSEKILEDPYMWNNYFLWSDDFSITHYEHEKNFNTVKDYPNLLAKSINEGISNSMAFKKEILNA
jgi:ubiquinone/menaquinone biosynthesis C-methylase UbiE